MPIDVKCDQCGKLYRLKDELEGKKFKCKQCDAIVLATPLKTGATPAKKKKPTTGAKPSTPKRKKKAASAAAPAAAAPKKKRKRPARKKKKANPFMDDAYSNDAYSDDAFGGTFDDFGDGDYGEPYDDYGDDDYGAAPPRKKKSRKKKKSSGGGLSVGFDINWFNIAMFVGGIAIVIAGVRESRLAAQAQAAPTEISLADLNANGLGDNIYLTVTGVSGILEQTAFYGTEEPNGDVTDYDKVWMPCVPAGEEPVGKNVHFIVYSTNANNDAKVIALGTRQKFTGLIINDIDPLTKDERQLLESGFPGANLGSALILEVDRAPSGAGTVILYFVGGTALSLGGLAWILLGGSAAESVAVARPVKPKAKKSSSGNPYKSKKAKPLSVGQLLFSFEGRVRRGTWWLSMISIGFGGFVASLGVSVISGLVNVDAVRLVGLFVILGLWGLTVFMQMAVTAKRWHDRGKSGWMNLIMLVPLIGAIWIFVECGFLPGAAGSNQYGGKP